MSYILFIVFYSYGFNKGFSVSEFKSKKACEMAMQEANKYYVSKAKCIEVKK